MILKSLFWIATIVPGLFGDIREANLFPSKHKARIVFSPESRMSINGKTNLSDYKCDCQTNSGFIPLCFVDDQHSVSFEKISLSIATEKINCNNNIYNSNIKKTLDAENYPFIRIDLLNARKTGSSISLNSSEWFQVISNTNITIRDVSRHEEVQAAAMWISGNKYRIKGSKQLNMSDFGIESPKFMLGLVRVRNNIVFEFDLFIEIVD
jgi:polyisoprenoid-binding protein YceI